MLVIFWRHPQERGMPEDGQHHAKSKKCQSPCAKKVISFDEPPTEILPCMMISSRHDQWIKPTVIKTETFNHDASRTPYLNILIIVERKAQPLRVKTSQIK
ncbi:hypothetical protein JO972_16710 [Verrucomicrobiaceae bacterium 5K15]|uniref:Uncharacterized protein n=1 Tax=Oceaniferula flava TaxID=2800421 RepID=A0AAE2SDY3_9BACT|nr:hypothetical protein [Oceaniferula flavus]MBK1856608.1 hypothetical protein [Oceaniferula flavus]MBM1137916.1 hypothetical protein [Oceaniferula flavus]